MSNAVTKVMLAAYEHEPEPTLFLSGQFQSPRSNFHNSEEVEIDIVRTEEEVSVAIQDLSTGARLNSEDIYTNKSFKPPVHKEAGPINAHKLISRLPGRNPFESVDFMVAAAERAMMLGRKLQRKIIRAIELQSSQVLTTGVVTLTDENGDAVYSIDYAPKTAHFPTAGVAWDNANSTKLSDIQSLANTIRGDGYNPDMLMMAEASFELFIQDQAVLDRFDNRRIAGNGLVALDRMGNGGIYRGTVEIGNYKYDVYTYPGRYKHPQTGTSTPFISDEFVIVRDSMARLDATFGGIPRIGSPDPRIPAGLFERISVPGQMVDLQQNAWLTADGETLMHQVGTRPLMIPTAIDSFGCLNTGI